MPKTVRDIIKDRKEVYCISNQTTVAEAARLHAWDDARQL
jgi:hypothetical protein